MLVENQSGHFRYDIKFETPKISTFALTVISNSLGFLMRLASDSPIKGSGVSVAPSTPPVQELPQKWRMSTALRSNTNLWSVFT